jgi:hypothetical protein
VAARSACEVECRVRRHDGAYRSFLVRGVSVLDDEGGIREWVGIGTDVTARKQAEAALRASEELRRTVVANAPIVLFAVDRDGIFTLSEGRGLADLGLRPDEHVGQSYFALYGHLHDSVAALKRTLAGEAATTVERYKDLVFETQWMPTRDADGTVTGATTRPSCRPPSPLSRSTCAEAQVGKVRILVSGRTAGQHAIMSRSTTGRRAVCAVIPRREDGRELWPPCSRQLMASSSSATGWPPACRRKRWRSRHACMLAAGAVAVQIVRAR